VTITSPGGECRVCGYKGRAKDPYFDTVSGKILISFYCEHAFDIDVTYAEL